MAMDAKDERPPVGQGLATPGNIWRALTATMARIIIILLLETVSIHTTATTMLGLVVHFT